VRTLRVWVRHPWRCLTALTLGLRDMIWHRYEPFWLDRELALCLLQWAEQDGDQLTAAQARRILSRVA